MKRPDDDFKRRKKLVMMNLVIALLVQLVVLALYYFQEKQIALAFPMILGILITFATILPLSQLGKDE